MGIIPCAVLNVINLMPKVDTPSTLYKYATADTIESVLRTGQLRWSSPALFNDPAEFQRIPRFEPPLIESLRELPRVLVEAALGKHTIDEQRLSDPARHLYAMIQYGLAQGMAPEEFINTIPEETRQLDMVYTELMRQHFGTTFISQARVMCLTANAVNPAMWANYASNHTGGLLGFRHIPEESTPFTEARPVTYSAEVPVLCSALDFLLYADNYLTGQRTIELVCFTKRAEWQYEQEWRTFSSCRSKTDTLFSDYPFLPQELESITFGVRTPENTRKLLSELVKENYPDSCIYQITLEHGEFVRHKT